MIFHLNFSDEISEKLRQIERRGFSVSSYIEAVISAELNDPSKNRAGAESGEVLFNYWIESGFPGCRKMGAAFGVTEKTVSKRMRKYLEQNRPDLLELWSSHTRPNTKAEIYQDKHVQS